jgi:hypothetical protein
MAGLTVMDLQIMMRTIAPDSALYAWNVKIVNQVENGLQLDIK